MKYVGIDLHKQTISVCVIAKVRGKTKVLRGDLGLWSGSVEDITRMERWEIREAKN